jgi:hypothetical protein
MKGKRNVKIRNDMFINARRIIIKDINISEGNIIRVEDVVNQYPTPHKI